MPVTRRSTREVGPASAGARDRYILIQWRPAADSVEVSGFPRDEWADFRWVYARRSVVSNDERFTSDQMLASTVQRWEVEYLEDMDPDVVDVQKRFRILYGGRVMDVIGATVHGRRRAIELVTLEASGVGAAAAR